MYVCPLFQSGESWTAGRTDPLNKTLLSCFACFIDFRYAFQWIQAIYRWYN